MTRTDLSFSRHLIWKLCREVLKQHVCGSISVDFDALERFLLKFLTADHPHPQFEQIPDSTQKRFSSSIFTFRIIAPGFILAFSAPDLHSACPTRRLVRNWSSLDTFVDAAMIL